MIYFIAIITALIGIVILMPTIGIAMMCMVIYGMKPFKLEKFINIALCIGASFLFLGGTIGVMGLIFHIITGS